MGDLVQSLNGEHEEQRHIALTRSPVLSLADLRQAMIAGWRDFRSYPQFGLFFGAT